MSRLLHILLLVAGCAPGVDRWSAEEDEGAVGNALDATYPESETLHLASTLDAEAQGFALGEGRATVAMRDMTCGVHVDSGSVFFDLDLRAGRIQDGTDDPDVRLTSLLVAPPLVHTVPLENPFGGESYLVRGVREARLLGDEGLVALRLDEETGNCEVRWYEDGHLASAVPLDGAFACEGDLDMAVDVDARQAWVAGPTGVWTVTPEDSSALDLSGDVLAFDASAGQLYAGNRGDTLLNAVVGDQVVWSRTLEGGLVDLDDAGDKGGVFVAHEAGPGADVLRLAVDGTEVDRLLFDRPVLEIAVSQGGGLMAVGRDADHGYYRVD